MKVNKNLIKTLKKNLNKELLVQVKGIYIPFEFSGLEGDFIVFKAREDFNNIIKEIKFERNS